VTYQVIFMIWGCIPEITSNCQDMTNASSTYIGIIIGAIIAGLITWWVYNRQNKTAKQQDKMLNKIIDLENLYIKTLESIEDLDKNHDATLQSILKIDEKVKKILEEKENII
jgi:cbb3-type cytochrome oxidase subunit 3